MSVRNLEDLADQHVRARRQRAIEVGAFHVKRDPPGGVTDDEWTVLGSNAKARAIADTVWLVAQPRSIVDEHLPERLAPLRNVAVFIVDFAEVIGIMQADPSGEVHFGAFDTRATATAWWPLKSVEPVKHRPELDFLERHAAIVERIRRLSVRPTPGDPGQYGRQSGWMRMTPASGSYVDEDAPARRMIAGDQVYIVCPGLELVDRAHVFTLGPSARPSARTRRVAELDGVPVLVEVRVTGEIRVLGEALDALVGVLTFDINYPLG